MFSNSLAIFHFQLSHLGIFFLLLSRKPVLSRCRMYLLQNLEPGMPLQDLQIKLSFHSQQIWAPTSYSSQRSLAFVTTFVLSNIYILLTMCQTQALYTH